ncbi:uncharacterized protein [Centruroides vittatus]|uniref:uncharacterized protein isoform X1 n=1 Tax=Centruroides vittatus TaxID=120091 RepID=UPI00350EC7F9
MAPGVVFDGSESNNPPGASGGDVPQPPPLPTTNNGLPTWRERQQSIKELPTPEVCDQFTNLPAALINSLKREKKPFTYTPGGIDLSEIKSPRMQKRLEANKRLQGVISPLARPPESVERQKELLVKPVYNSPLSLYSTQNAKEEFQKQASLLTQELESMKISPNGEIIRSQSFGQEGFPKYSQSKSFRLLQLMTDTTDNVSNESPVRRKTEDDEMTFTGVTRNPIPSKFFQTLQRITGTDGESPESPEPPPVFEHWGDPCTLQTATYGKDFIPEPKPYKPFERRDFNETPAAEMPKKKSQINIQVSGNYAEPTYQKQEFQQKIQPMNQPYSENQASSGYQKQSSNTYKQKNPQPYIRPNFQARDVATSNSWQPFNHPYNYCTLPRSYRGIPGYEGTDL